MYDPTYVNHPYDPGPPPPPPDNILVTQLLEKITILDAAIDDLAKITAALTIVVEELRKGKPK